MDLGLTNKRAIVAGGSRGIGLATAILLAKEGAKVAIIARGEAQLRDAVAEIRGETKSIAHAFAADLAHTEEAEAAVERAAQKLGGLDILVNCAGGAPTGSALEADDRDWRSAIEVKLMGNVRLCRAAVPLMTSGGAVVSVAGSWGREPDANAAVASTVNAGIAAFSKSLARLVAREKIRVFCINPTAVRTDLWLDVAKGLASKVDKSHAEFTRLVASAIPLGRIAEPDDVARVIVFLVSEAASFLTGLAVDVDGGSHHSLF